MEIVILICYIRSRDVDRLYDQVYTQSEEAQAQANEAYQAVLGVYSEAQTIEIPVVSPQNLSTEAAMISQEVN